MIISNSETEQKTIFPFTKKKKLFRDFKDDNETDAQCWDVNVYFEKETEGEN